MINGINRSEMIEIIIDKYFDIVDLYEINKMVDRFDYLYYNNYFKSEEDALKWIDTY